MTAAPRIQLERKSLSVHHIARVLAIIFGSALITWLLWGPLLGAQWWIIDDAYWIGLVGNRPSLPFTEMLAQFTPSGCHLGSAVNRPSYFIIHAIWAFLFGKNVLLWYLSKMLCFLGATAAFWFAFDRLVELPLAGLLTFGIAIQPYWTDIMTRVQSCELLGALGCGLFLAGAVLLLKERDLTPANTRLLPKWRARAAISCIAVGGFIAVGSKENFTVLICAVVPVLMMLELRLGRSKLLLLTYTAVLAFGAVVLYGIYFGVLRRGVDLYGVGVGTRVSRLSSSLAAPGTQVILVVLGWLAVLHVIAGLAPGTLSLNRKTLGGLFAVQSYLLFARIFLYFFYSVMPAASRYEFPYLAIPALSGALCYAAVLRGEMFGFLSPRTKWAIRCVGLCLAALFVMPPKIGFNRNFSQRFAEATRVFQSRLVAVENAIRREPGTALVFQSHAPSDFEPLVSLHIFLRARGLQNPLYLEQVGYSEATATDGQAQLLFSLQRALTAPGGLHPYGELSQGVGFYPYAELSPEMPRKVITFSKPDLPPGALANFWPIP
jgi:hypothetical protein